MMEVRGFIIYYSYYNEILQQVEGEGIDWLSLTLDRKRDQRPLQAIMRGIGRRLWLMGAE